MTENDTNINERNAKTSAFDRLAAEVESLILPSCKFCRSGEQTREEKNQNLTKRTRALHLITEHLKTYDTYNEEPEHKTFDSEACFQAWNECLENYRPEGKSFMHLFMKIYKMKRPKSADLQERLDAVDSDLARHAIRDRLREFLAKHGIGSTEATELFHSFFSKDTFLYANSREKFLKKLLALKKLKCTEDDIRDFEYSLKVDGYVDSIDKDTFDELQYDIDIDEDEIDPIEIKKKEDNFDYICALAEKAYEIAANDAEQNYLRTYLTLIVLKLQQDEKIPGLMKYIDKTYYEEHRWDDHDEAYQEASSKAREERRRIQEEAFKDNAREELMARYLRVRPSTVRTYCNKGYKLMLQATEALRLEKE